MAISRLNKERSFSIGLRVITIFTLLLVAGMAVGLFIKAYPILEKQSLTDLLFSTSWMPLQGKFGLLPFIIGSLWVTGIAIIIGVPLSLLTSIYLTEYAGKRIRELANPLIDLLAGIPSVIYGVWGVITIVPFIKNVIAPLLGVTSSGYTVLAAGIVLAIMIAPVMIHVTNDVISAIPNDLRYAALSLGATKWQTIKHVVLRKSLPGIVAAVVLGLSRAFGETMAVLMVAGNVVQIPGSMLDQGYPLPALIANNYGEMMSVPLYDASLMLAALILFAIVVVFNIISHYVLIRIKRRIR